jgi:hypothetical protein
LEYDCNDECGGTAVVDECGECGGDGPEENFDCDGNCLVNIDCNGVCGGDATYDACGDCGGNGSDCNNPEATLSFGDLGGDVMLEINYSDPTGEICLANPILSDAVGNSVTVIVGECILLDESSGVLDLYLNSSIGIAGFQFNIHGLTITGASGGSAEDNGFTVSSSATTGVVAEEDTVNPLSSALPPLAPVIVNPWILNWNPAIPIELFKYKSKTPLDSSRRMHSPTITVTEFPTASDKMGFAKQISPVGSE